MAVNISADIPDAITSSSSTFDEDQVYYYANPLPPLDNRISTIPIRESTHRDPQVYPNLGHNNNFTPPVQESISSFAQAPSQGLFPTIEEQLRRLVLGSAMVTSAVSEEIGRIESSSESASDKSAAYSALLSNIFQSSTAENISDNLKAFLDSLLGETVGIVSSRPLLITFVDSLKKHNDTTLHVEVGQHALHLLQSRVVSFAEQDAQVRDMVASGYELAGEHSAAAKVLQGTQLDSSQRTVIDDDKIRVWIRIMRNYLEEDDTTNAEIYLNRAKGLLYKCQDQELNLLFQLSQARILDARWKFLEACQVYHNLSFSTAVVEEERLRALSSAIVCAVLAPAGPQRSRTLARLYKDDRAMQVGEHGILEKIFLDRLLEPEEVDGFAANLAPHQLAPTADGSTVLAKAVIEHNLLAASRVYEDIGFERLGELLGVSANKAEEYAAHMIQQGRLSGHIDQIEGYVFFTSGSGGEASGEKIAVGQSDRQSRPELRRWDQNVQSVTEEVERITAQLQRLFPEFVAKHLKI